MTGWAGDRGGLERIDLGEVPYQEAVSEMGQWVRQRQQGLVGDRLVLLTHPPVITYGARTPRHELPVVGSVPLVEVDCGGQATYHGPGQLIGYLVINLRERGPGDVVRWLEHGLIRAIESLGLPALRRDTPPGAQSLVGVWTPGEEKIASIGMPDPPRRHQPRVRPQHRPRHAAVLHVRRVRTVRRPDDLARRARRPARQAGAG